MIKIITGLLELSKAMRDAKANSSPGQTHLPGGMVIERKEEQTHDSKHGLTALLSNGYSGKNDFVDRLEQISQRRLENEAKLEAKLGDADEPDIEAIAKNTFRP